MFFASSFRRPRRKVLHVRNCRVVTPPPGTDGGSRDVGNFHSGPAEVGVLHAFLLWVNSLQPGLHFFDHFFHQVNRRLQRFRIEREFGSSRGK